MLVGIRGVVLLRDEIREEGVGQRLVAVGVDAGHVDRDRILVADVLAERHAGRAVEDDHSHRPLEADEEVVLTPLVVVEAANHATARMGEVHLPNRFRERARAGELAEPASVVAMPLERDAAQSLDHPRRPLRTKSFTV